MEGFTVSDDDRLCATIARLERHVRTLPDGCDTCGSSGLACRASRYLNGNDAYCCPDCDHA